MLINKNLIIKVKKANILRYNKESEKLREKTSELDPFERDLILLISNNMNVLDIGAGKGIFLGIINSPKIGLDISLKNLKNIKKRNEITNLYLVLADAENLPIKDSCIDLVHISNTLHHLPNYLITLKETIRILKNKSLLFLSEPNRIGIPFVSLIEKLSRIKRNFTELYSGLDTYKIFNLFKRNNIFVSNKIQSPVRFMQPYFILWYYDLLIRTLDLIIPNNKIFFFVKMKLRRIFSLLDKTIEKLLSNSYKTWIQGLFIKKLQFK